MLDAVAERTSAAEHLAAPTLCAGLMAYKAILNADVKPG